jgi:hypothetical protein
MTPNEQIIQLLDNYSNPYDNDKIDHLVEKLLDSCIFHEAAIDDLTQCLISKKDNYRLLGKYTDLDYRIIKEFLK